YITSSTVLQFPAGQFSSYTITTAGTPSLATSLNDSNNGAATLQTFANTMGLTFTNNSGTGTATISGTPPLNSIGNLAGGLNVTINDASGIPTTTNFTIQVVPAFTSTAIASFTAGQASNFNVTTQG